MKKIRGNDLILMYDVDGKWKAIAFGTTCEIDINAEVIEVSSPDTGKWVKVKKRKLSWSVSTAHLMGNVKKTPDLLDMLQSDEAIKICIGSVEAHPNQIDHTEYALDGRYAITGYAQIVRATITARKGDMVTISAELRGDGALKQAWASWVLVDGAWTNKGVWNDEGIWE